METVLREGAIVHPREESREHAQNAAPPPAAVRVEVLEDKERGRGVIVGGRGAPMVAPAAMIVPLGVMIVAPAAMIAPLGVMIVARAVMIVPRGAPTVAPAAMIVPLGVMIVAPAATGAPRGEMIGVHAVMADRQGETIVALAGTIAAPAEMPAHRVETIGTSEAALRSAKPSHKSVASTRFASVPSAPAGPSLSSPRRSPAPGVVVMEGASRSRSLRSRCACPSADLPTVMR